MSDYKISHHVLGRITEVIFSLSSDKAEKRLSFNIAFERDDDWSFSVYKGPLLHDAQITFREGSWSHIGVLSYPSEGDSNNCFAEILCDAILLESLISFRHDYVGALISLSLSEDQKAIRFSESLIPDECGLIWDTRESRHVPISSFNIIMRYKQDAQKIE